MKKKLAFLLAMVLLISASFAGCKPKLKLSDEKKEQIEALNVPLSLIPEGAKVEIENGIVTYQLKIKLDKLVDFYTKELAELKTEDKEVLNTEQLVEQGLLSELYPQNDLGAWSYDGKLENGESIFVFLQEQPIYDSKFVRGVILVGGDQFGGEPVIIDGSTVTGEGSEVEMVIPEATTGGESTAEGETAEGTSATETPETSQEQTPETSTEEGSEASAEEGSATGEESPAA